MEEYMEEGEEEGAYFVGSSTSYFPNREILHINTWPVMLTPHAVERAMERFHLSSWEEAETWLLDQLENAEVGRKMPSGALRWANEHIQLVTVEKDECLIIVTCYRLSTARRLHALRNRRWGKKRFELYKRLLGGK